MGWEGGEVAKAGTVGVVLRCWASTSFKAF